MTPEVRWVVTSHLTRLNLHVCASYKVDNSGVYVISLEYLDGSELLSVPSGPSDGQSWKEEVGLFPNLRELNIIFKIIEERSDDLAGVIGRLSLWRFPNRPAG